MPKKRGSARSRFGKGAPVACQETRISRVPSTLQSSDEAEEHSRAGGRSRYAGGRASRECLYAARRPLGGENRPSCESACTALKGVSQRVVVTFHMPLIT
jgi:hypothetical protein